jgi:hypothetical protein
MAEQLIGYPIPAPEPLEVLAARYKVLEQARTIDNWDEVEMRLSQIIASIPTKDRDWFHVLCGHRW